MIRPKDSCQSSCTNSSASSITVYLKLISFLIKNDIRLHKPQSIKRHNAVLIEKVHQTSRSSDQNVTAFAQVLSLRTRGGTAVNTTRAKHRSITQLPGFVEYLKGKFTTRSENEDKRFSTDTVCLWIERVRIRTRGGQLLCLPYQS